LVVVIIQASDVGAGELGNLSGRATDATAHVQHPHALLDVDLMGKVVLMPGNGLVKRLAVRKAAEVEGLAPSVLVDVGREVVIAGQQEVNPGPLVFAMRLDVLSPWRG